MWSFSMIITIIFSVWIAHTTYSLYRIYNIPSCDSTEANCLKPSWKEDDAFQVRRQRALSHFPNILSLDTSFLWRLRRVIILSLIN